MPPELEEELLLELEEELDEDELLELELLDEELLEEELEEDELLASVTLTDELTTSFPTVRLSSTA